MEKKNGNILYKFLMEEHEEMGKQVLYFTHYAY